MPRKATNATMDTDGGEQAAPRRSGRIASQPKTEEAPKPAPKRRATKKRTVDEGDGDEEGAGGKPKKVKADGEEANTDAGDGDTQEAKADTEEAKTAMDTTEDTGAEETPVLASIDIGGSLPSLVLKNEKDEDLQVAQIAGEKGAVLFLVPKADTPGCTKQACGFRDIYPDFTQHGYAVYCLSADSPTAQNKWQTKKELPYPLISDPKRVLITALGAGEGGRTQRSHFIFDKEGKLVDKKLPVSPADSPKLALEFIKGANADAPNSSAES